VLSRSAYCSLHEGSRDMAWEDTKYHTKGDEGSIWYRIGGMIHMTLEIEYTQSEQQHSLDYTDAQHVLPHLTLKLRPSQSDFLSKPMSPQYQPAVLHSLNLNPKCSDSPHILRVCGPGYLKPKMDEQSLHNPLFRRSKRILR
jgi:hypothetical protein